MSTKATIACGDNFHLYHELCDGNHIYLELDTTQFEARYGQVTVPIPIHIWEVIREFPGIRLDLDRLSNSQLRQKVEQDVNSRILAWRRAKDKNRKWVLELCGCLPYGRASEPRTKQIRKGLRYYREQRKWQREVKAAIEKLGWENSSEGRKLRQAEHNRRAEKFQAAFKAARERHKLKKSKAQRSKTESEMP